MHGLSVCDFHDSVSAADEETLGQGESHDQWDAKWMVIRRPLRVHNDMPFGRLIPSRPIGRPGVGRPKGVFGGLSYY
jgi:hypothetical protein